MNRGIFFLLGGIVIAGLLVLYALSKGPALLLQPPEEERIAFVSDRDGQTDIWSMRTDGSDLRRVTDDPSQCIIADWSPDGKELLYMSDKRNQTYQIYLAAWDGRYIRPVTISEGTKDHPTWTSDGKEIAFISAGKVYFKKREGGREEQYLPPPGMAQSQFGRLLYTYASWSPNREQLLYIQDTDTNREAYVGDREFVTSWGAASQKPIGITAARHLSACWMPSGELVVGYIDRKGENGILIADVAAVTAGDIMMLDEDKGPGKIAVSPDGQKIAFEMWDVVKGTPNRPSGIYVVDKTGRNLQPVLLGPATEPSWSPDGKRIACSMMNERGYGDIWVVRVDGSDPVNLTNGEGENRTPRWSPGR